MKLVDKNATGTPPPVHVPDTALQHNGARRDDNLSTSFCLGETIIHVVRQRDVTRYLHYTGYSTE